MTELATDSLPHARSERRDLRTARSFPTTWTTASSGSRSLGSTIVSTPSTTSAPAPTSACPLSGGLLDGHDVMCQCHGSRFDIATGAAIAGPATEALTTYEVEEVDGTVRVRV